FAFENGTKHFQWLLGQWAQAHEAVDVRYRQFPADLVANLRGYAFANSRGVMLQRYALSPEAARTDLAAGVPLAMEHEALMEKRAETFFGADKAGLADGKEPVTATRPKGPDLSQVATRRNLNETAFFYPQLISDSNGIVRMTFTMPEALTTRRLLAFAHDKDRRSGSLEGKA